MSERGSRPMCRWFSALVPALSLVVSVATFTLWMRSYWYIDAFSWQHAAGYRQLSSERGRILLLMRPSLDDHAYGFATFPVFHRYGRLVGTRALGFVFYRGERAAFYEVPYWFISAFFLLLPLRAVSRRLRVIAGRRRMARGQCSQCGYDLRATADRCPECGMSAVAQTINVNGGFVMHW